MTSTSTRPRRRSPRWPHWLAFAGLFLFCASLFVAVPLIAPPTTVSRTPGDESIDTGILHNTALPRLVPVDGRHMELLFPTLWAQGLAGTLAAQLVVYDVSLVKSALAQISLSTIYYVAWFAVLEGRSGAVVPVANQRGAVSPPVCTEARDIVDHLSSSRLMKGEQDIVGFLDIRDLWKDPRRGSDLRQPSVGKYSTTQVLEGVDGLMKILREPEFNQLIALLPLT